MLQSQVLNTLLILGLCDEEIVLSRRVLFDIMQDGPARNFNGQCDHLYNHLMEITHCPEASPHVIKLILRRFTSDLNKRWQSANRTKERFLIKNEKWLEAGITFPLYSTKPLKTSGRPPVDFCDSSERSKRRKTESLRSEYSASELSYAAQMSLRISGDVDAAYVVKTLRFLLQRELQSIEELMKRVKFRPINFLLMKHCPCLSRQS